MGRGGWRRRSADTRDLRDGFQAGEKQERGALGCAGLAGRLTGPVMDSVDGSRTPVGALTDDEYLWEPVADCWSVRRRTDGPGARAILLAAGTGDWGRDAAPHPHPVPPPFTTLAWRLSPTPHPRRPPCQRHRRRGDRRLRRGRRRLALRDTADTDLDTVGRCTYPHGSDVEEPFLDIVWWVNQAVLHHGAGITRPNGRIRPRAPDRSGTPRRSRAARPGPPGRSSRTRCRTRGRGSRCRRRPWWHRRRRSRSGASR